MADARIEQVDNVLVEIETAQHELKSDLQTGFTLGQRLRDACSQIAMASSNSWAGWHSRMYYGNWDEPPVHETWDIEWGGLNGYADEWHECSQREVQDAVEARAGTSLAVLAAAADRVRERCQDLHAELVTALSPICDLPGFGREAEMLAKIDGIMWIRSPSDFIRALSPKEYSSRDTRALRQGLQAPLHLNVETAIVSNTTTLKVCEDFLRDALRVARQARTKLAAELERPRGTPPQEILASDANHVATGEQDLARRLRAVTWVLFLVLALAVVAGMTYVVHRFNPSSLAEAALIAAGALLVLGLYAVLLDRNHAKRALVVAVTAATAIAALDQLLAHFHSSPHK